LPSNLTKQHDWILERQPDVSLHAYVLSLSSFGLSDGSVQFRVRETMEVSAPNGEEEFKTLPQVGFSFPVDAPESTGLHMVLSPNNCCAVTMNADGDVRLKVMEFLQTNLETIKEEDGMCSACTIHLTVAAAFGPVSAVFTTYCVTSWMSYQTADDLFAMLPKNTSRGMSTGYPLTS
jgi:hypothetical protein